MKAQGYLIVESIHRAKDDEAGGYGGAASKCVRVVCSPLNTTTTQRICVEKIEMILARNNANDDPVRVGQRLRVIIDDEASA